MMKNLLEEALTQQASSIRAEFPRLQKAHHVILNEITRVKSGDASNIGTLHFTAYLLLFGMTTHFKPDIIIELGRGEGNSTFVFSRYCQLNPGCEFHSFGLEDWNDETLALRRAFPDFQYDPESIHHMDLRLFDYDKVITGDKRCLVFFDAHGFDATDAFLSLVLPLMAGRPHLVLVDDIWDARYDYARPIMGGENPAKGANRGYDGKTIWTGPKLPVTATIRTGHLETIYEEGILIYDFASRNGLPVHTARHDFERWLKDNPDTYSVLERDVEGRLNPDEAFQIYFTMEEAGARRLTFPAPSTKLRADRTRR